MAETIYETIKDSDGVECFIKRGNLVRCRDCTHMNSPKGCVMFCKHVRKFVDENWYCAEGERRTE